jgi:hypothetical protein
MRFVRRKCHPKTDPLDAVKLAAMLLRYHVGWTSFTPSL